MATLESKYLEQNGSLLYPSLYYEGSTEYFPSDENWMTHSSCQWMHCIEDGSYYHIETNTYYTYDPDTDQFYEFPTAEDLEQEEIVTAAQQLQETNQDTPDFFYPTDYEQVTSFVNAHGEETLSQVWLERLTSHLQNNDEYFFLDFDNDISFHTSEIMSSIPGKIDREDRHVTKQRLSIESETQACCLLTAIYDGHGGSYCADYCVQQVGENVLSEYAQAQNILRKKLVKKGLSLGREAVITDLGLIYSADVESLRRALQKAYELTDRCTALTLLFYGPDVDGSLKLLTAHAGDCRAVLCRAGTAIRLTEDHKPNKKNEKKRIEQAGGRVVYVKGVWRVMNNVGKRVFGLSTARSIGDFHMKTPKNLVPSIPDLKIFTIDFYRDLFVILGSDGIWDVLSDQEACDIASKHLVDATYDQAPTSLVTIANDRGSTDDKTATVIFFTWRRDLFNNT